MEYLTLGRKEEIKKWALADHSTGEEQNLTSDFYDSLNDAEKDYWGKVCGEEFDRKHKADARRKFNELGLYLEGDSHTCPYCERPFEKPEKYIVKVIRPEGK